MSTTMSHPKLFDHYEVNPLAFPSPVLSESPEYFVKITPLDKNKTVSEQLQPGDSVGILYNPKKTEDMQLLEWRKQIAETELQILKITAENTKLQETLRVMQLLDEQKEKRTILMEHELQLLKEQVDEITDMYNQKPVSVVAAASSTEMEELKLLYESAYEEIVQLCTVMHFESAVRIFEKIVIQVGKEFTPTVTSLDDAEVYMKENVELAFELQEVGITPDMIHSGSAFLQAYTKFYPMKDQEIFSLTSNRKHAKLYIDIFAFVQSYMQKENGQE